MFQGFPVFQSVSWTPFSSADNVFSLLNAHMGVELVLGLGLIVGGLLALGVPLRNVVLSTRWTRMGLYLVGLLFVVAGINQLAETFISIRGADEIAFAQYMTLSFVIGAGLVLLSLILLRVFGVRKIIESLRGEIDAASKIAEQVSAQQRELSARYAENAAALEHKADEAYRFAALVRSSKDAVIGVNEDGSIWYWNPAAEELCKRRAEDAVGRSLDVVKISHNGNLWKEVQRIMALPFLRGQAELPLLCGEGLVVPVWVSVSKLPENSRGGGGFAIIARNMTDKKIVEEKISESLVEKEALLKEVHHRVKNNLQLICSLLRLQAKEAVDESALKLFRKSEERVRSLALVHEKLYRSESLSTIDFGSYLEDLLAQLVRSAGPTNPPIGLEYSGAEIKFPIDSAITCGLIVNELVTNSIKHSSCEGQPTKLRVVLAREDRNVTISVWDNGTGVVDTAAMERPVTLGLNLVRALVRQLGGTLTITQDGGLECKVSLPDSVLKLKENVAHRVAA